jgi:glyoxylase-like metal-dependent hydrolase (beta-lactamase superfamily II)
MQVQVVEAAPDVFLAVGSRTNWCLIRDGDAITLIDAAWPKDYPAVVDSLHQIGAGPDQVDAAVLTHAHSDHAGVAERLRAEHGAVVRTHRAEVGHATGEYHQRVRPIDLLARMWRPSVAVFAVGSIARGGTDPTPVAGVEAFGGSPLDVPGRPVPVTTPGHTSGHCSFHLPGSGIVITGDALVNRNVLTNRPGPRLMPRIFSHDWEQALVSLDALAVLDAHVLLPGQGAPLHMPASEAVAQAKQSSAMLAGGIAEGHAVVLCRWKGGGVSMVLALPIGHIALVSLRLTACRTSQRPFSLRV